MQARRPDLNLAFARKLFNNEPDRGWIVETQYFKNNEELRSKANDNIPRIIKFLYLFHVDAKTYELAFKNHLQKDSKIQALGLDSLSVETVKSVCECLPYNLERISINNLEKQSLKELSKALSQREHLVVGGFASAKVIEVSCGPTISKKWQDVFKVYAPHKTSMSSPSSTATILSATSTPSVSPVALKKRKSSPDALSQLAPALATAVVDGINFNTATASKRIASEVQYPLPLPEPAYNDWLSLHLQTDDIFKDEAEPTNDAYRAMSFRLG